MKIENQVVSLELAKRLLELGVDKESLFYWMIPKNKADIEAGMPRDGEYVLARLRDFGSVNLDWLAAAFTVAELGEMLPAYIRQPNSGEMINLQMQKMDEDSFVISIMSRTDKVYGVGSTKEANARALMLIYLLENNLLPTKEGIQ